jgi:nitrite reductase (NADH) small subunit
MPLCYFLFGPLNGSIQEPKLKVRLCSTSDLPGESCAREFLLEGKPVCVARLNGTVFALDNVCPHRGGPLSDGVILDGKIVCPWHGWQFDLQTGMSVQVPDTGVAVCRISIEGNDVFLEK